VTRSSIRLKPADDLNGRVERVKDVSSVFFIR
jgi:hypothetical protein